MIISQFSNLWNFYRRKYDDVLPAERTSKVEGNIIYNPYIVKLV